MTPESKLRLEIVRELIKMRRNGAPLKWLAVTPGFGVEVGTPDMLVVCNGQAYWFELKAGKNKVTVIQKERLKQWEEAGAVCCVARSVNDVIRELIIR
jgi:hypothetical protein